MVEFWDILDEDGNKTGRLHERGNQMKKGEFHHQVCIWIVNDKGEFLISKRSPNRHSMPNIWECTGGNTVAGDDSLNSALKEVREELGVTLNPDDGFLFKEIKHIREDGSGKFMDVWIFRQEVDISAIILQPEETCDAMWATKNQIIKMIDEGEFTMWEMSLHFDMNELYENCCKIV
jgi:isopentenyldiphosphate isomerase